MRPRLIYKRLK
ncbi:hypothetical protein D041_0411A, partial [Vibrio parahaemolyticus EKP-008]